jgi:hypothetical protein
MPKKPGFSRDEHTELGAELAQMRDRLGNIAVQLDRAYPHAVSDLALSAQTAIDALRSQLDSIVFSEYPAVKHPGNAIVYYPDREPK